MSRRSACPDGALRLRLAAAGGTSCACELPTQPGLEAPARSHDEPRRLPVRYVEPGTDRPGRQGGSRRGAGLAGTGCSASAACRF